MKLPVRGNDKISLEDLTKMLEPTMTLKQVQAVVNHQMKKNKLASKLGLHGWKITIDYGECEQPEWAAQCAQDPAYKIAHIRIDPNMQKDVKDVQDSLLHELMHIMVSPLEAFFMVQLAGCKEDSADFGRQLEHWRQANEQVVCALTESYTPLLGA